MARLQSDLRLTLASSVSFVIWIPAFAGMSGSLIGLEFIPLYRPASAPSLRVRNSAVAASAFSQSA